jgi:hypothetical protein
MGRIEKTLFISYRHADEAWGLAIFQDLTQHGYDPLDRCNALMRWESTGRGSVPALLCFLK